jgi:hypothetical protein
MAGPLLSLTLWDPERSDQDLLDACAQSLRDAGAMVLPIIGVDRPTRLLRDYAPFCPPEEAVPVRAARPHPGPGGLVEVAVPYDYLDVLPRYRFPKPDADALRAEREAAFAAAVARLVGDVRPLLAVWPVEAPVERLALLDHADSDLLFGSGWVDPGRLDDAQAAALAEVLGPARVELAGGWSWTGGRAALSRAVWSALARRAELVAPPEEEEEPLPEPPPVPQLWFWAADRDDSRLLEDVRAWAAGQGLPADRVSVDDQGGPGWSPVVVDLVDEADEVGWEELGPVVRRGLDLLRRAVAAVRPSWAALLPNSGFLVPGVNPDVPATGVLPNVWVSAGWMPPADRQQLQRTLDGAHREEFAGGLLLVTTPLAADDVAPWSSDKDAWWARLVDAAAVLGRTARATRTAP